MKRQYSLGYLTAPACAPPEMIYLAARAGYDYVSLRTIAMGLPGEPDFGLARNLDLLKKTRNALQETGVQLLDIENARIHDAVDLHSYYPEMDVAAELGARAVLTNIWSANANLIRDSFGQLCEYGQTLGLSINLEFVTWSSVKNIQDAANILRQSGYENCGMVVDALHFHRSRCSIEELSTVPSKYLTALHLCDAPAAIPENVADLIHAGRAERLYVGEGGIDIAGIVEAMPTLPLGLEIPHLERVATIGPAEHVFRCREYAETYLNAANPGDRKRKD